jgi:8-oxo-dGTP pyrophosphatase MutT (NUDIX family)
MNTGIAHTYCIPYYFDKKKKETFVLLGLKKKFNYIQGYIHANPGQLVLIGGHLKKHVSFPKNVEIEFEEETGHKLNSKKIFLDKENYTKYFITAYYKCSFKEFRKFDKLINTNEKFKEIDKLVWISFDKVFNVMIQHNKNVIYNIPKFSLEYTNEFKKRKWNLSLEINELIWKIRNKHNLGKNINNKTVVKNYIHNNLNNRSFFNQTNKIIKKYIYKISEYNWFEESLYKFKQFHYQNKKNRQDSFAKKNIKSTPNFKSPPKKKSSKSKSPPKKKSSKSKSPPKKKSSKSPPKKKSSKSPKRKYIPPHLR